MVDANLPFGLNATRRYVSQGAEGILFSKNEIPSGYVELVDYMGGDDMVERVATAGRGRGIFRENPNQLEFLHHLTTRGIYAPFKSVQLKLNFQVPIETALLFVYDKDCSPNEYSGRYSTMIQSAEKLDADELAERLHNSELARRIVALYDDAREKSLLHYSNLLGLDFTRELARSGLGINNDTRFFWKNDLESTARLVDAARRRLPKGDVTRQCVEAVAEIAHNIAPYAWNALMSNGNFSLDLTMPRDHAVVDPGLAPSLWGESTTKRVTVPALEDLLFSPKKILDHGELQVVDYMGDDPAALAQAARTSYGDGTKKLTDDAKLIDSLVRDEHTSPVEMAELAIEAKTPMFTDPRQAKRHRTLDHHGFMGYNPVGNQFYLPQDSQFKYQDRVNRQGRGKEMEESEKTVVRAELVAMSDMQLDYVRELQRIGAPEDVVRKIKGVGFYTIGWRTGDAHSWSKFFKLRSDAHAQYEVRAYSDAVQEIFKVHLPMTYESLRMHVLESIRLSTKEQEFIARNHAQEGLHQSLLSDIAFTIPVDSKDPAKGRKLSREGEGFARKLGILFPKK